MHGTLGCPVCGAANIAFGSIACPNCGVAFASPIVTPRVIDEPAPIANAAAVAVAPARHAIASYPTAPDLAPADGVRYASIWARMGAAGIDWCIFAVPAIGLMGWDAYWNAGWVPRDALDWGFTLGWFVYVAAMQSSSWQATLGMRAFDLRIQREDDFGTISPWRAVARELLTFVSALVLMIGYLMIAFTEKRQALHDKIAGTVVLHDPR